MVLFLFVAFLFPLGKQADSPLDRVDPETHQCQHEEQADDDDGDDIIALNHLGPLSAPQLLQREPHQLSTGTAMGTGPTWCTCGRKRTKAVVPVPALVSGLHPAAAEARSEFVGG